MALSETELAKLSVQLAKPQGGGSTIQPIQLSSFFRLNDSPPTDAVTMMIYGPSKSGKTHLIATLGDDTLYLDTGKGSDTLRNATVHKLYGPVNPIIFKCEEAYGDFGLPEKAVGFDTACMALDFAFKNLSDKFTKVVVDDLTTLRKFAIFKALDINQALRKSQTKTNIVEQFNALLPAIQDYGSEMSLIEQFVEGYINICKRENKHLIIIAHERQYYEYVKDPSSGRPITTAPKEVCKVRPAVTGVAFPDSITSMFDAVMYATKMGDKYVLRTKSDDDKILADTRFSGLWANIVPDALEKDRQKIEKWKKGANLQIMLDDIAAAKKAGIIISKQEPAK